MMGITILKSQVLIYILKKRINLKVSVAILTLQTGRASTAY
ncbi:MAG: hypothetical protein JWP37_2016 [Mucilaginibacter sp.]|nr:hypothetical protein [Mucilaginibacter sp.]